MTVRRLNIDGDGQGDLQGHGGEHRAVMVYQLASYRYWEQYLKRSLEHGEFGENLTVDGLADDEVCIGDRYRVGTALLEVTQPRVTCYRVGMRLRNAQMPSLLVSHKRPGFYCRVIEEGEIGAGDPIVKERSGGGMTVADIDALLYLSAHPGDQLERAIRIPALSEGWRRPLPRSWPPARRCMEMRGWPRPRRHRHVGRFSRCARSCHAAGERLGPLAGS